MRMLLLCLLSICYPFISLKPLFKDWEPLDERLIGEVVKVPKHEIIADT